MKLLLHMNLSPAWVDIRWKGVRFLFYTRVMRIA